MLDNFDHIKAYLVMLGEETASVALNFGADDIDGSWFSGEETVLITAGASAPEQVVADCVAFLRERFGADVESRVVRKEEVHFALPRELRAVAE